MPRTAGEEFERRLRDALDGSVELLVGEEVPDPEDHEVLVSGRPRPEELEASPSLKMLIIPFAGLPPETREQMLQRPEIAVHNLHHNASSTAEVAMALLLSAAHRVLPLDASLRRDDWSPRYGEERGILMDGATGLVVGYGSVGRRVAKGLQGLGMDVMATRRGAGGVEEDEGVEVHPFDRLDVLLPRARAVVLCVPLTDETEGLLDERRLDLLPEPCVLVNVARGPVVDEGALFAGLRRGRPAAAGIDTWYAYPKGAEERGSTPPSAYPFRELENVVMSPHRAGLVRETEERRAAALAGLLLSASRGEPVAHRVHPARGY
jgi:phosphoglycerate dehydrogenase-like enzyme